MIVSFADDATEDLFYGNHTKASRRRLPNALRSIAGRKLEQLDSAIQLEDLKVPPGNRLEALRGDRKGQLSIRINEQYRIRFQWTEQGPADVEVVDYHD
jgi:proteic killer suppression protein